MSRCPETINKLLIAKLFRTKYIKTINCGSIQKCVQFVSTFGGRAGKLREHQMPIEVIFFDKPQ
jgi:hypothetical protein